ncbi:MAG: phosphatidate cytidylyltransferase [Chloroflexi bacterium]|nr:phosphatidate cytidylyltransferase [Chloroflexota bacterium]MCI0848772.1 phosphatidate cytidylyltransferase [Chloroflexota bacterium]
MLQRSLTALVGIPVLVGAVWLGAPWLTVLVLAAGVAGVWELYRMTPATVGPLPVFLGAAWVVAMVSGAQAASGRDNFLIISGGVMAAGSFAALLWFIAFYRGAGPAGIRGYSLGFSYLILGPIYVGFLLGHALMLREIPGPGGLGLEPSGTADLGRSWLLFAILVTFAVDTGAYLVGRAVGSRPMAPSISPNKTWEGSLGGFAAAVAAAVALGLVFDLEIPVWQQAVIGGVVGVVAQWGDLIESKLKRIADVKDAGSIIPGHGGLLDRLDSLLLTLPAVYYLLVTVFAP